MKRIDHFVEKIGKAVSWLSLLLVLVIVIDVMLRYLFSITSAASFELEWHLFAVIFLLGSSYALQEDKHVRVDVFYQGFSEKGKAWVNLFGTLFFLLPFCCVASLESLSFVQRSYEIQEVSPQPGGLPYRWVIKSTIPLGFFLLALQAFSITIKNLKVITS